MSDRSEDASSVEIAETLAGRRPGASARDMARRARAADPLRAIAARFTRVRTDDLAWTKGARGERFVGWLLGRLPDGWYVFHDVPVGTRGANIDHLVIGPGGVFTVNTKNLTGKAWVGPRTLRVDGRRKDFLPKAVAEARRASRQLGEALGRPVEVRPVLALIVDRFTVKEMPTDVHVGTPRGVKRWMLAQPAVLSAAEVLEIAGVAHRPSTWTSGQPWPAAAHDGPRPLIEAGAPCPCGGTIVRRVRRSDGAPFLGCSRFPSCRRTWPA